MHDYEEVPNILNIFGDSVCDFSDFEIDSNLPALLSSSPSDQSATNDELALLLSPHTLSNILPLDFVEQQNCVESEKEEIESTTDQTNIRKALTTKQSNAKITNKQNNINNTHNTNATNNIMDTKINNTNKNTFKNKAQQNKRKRRKKRKTLVVKKKIMNNNQESTITQRFPLNGIKSQEESEQKMKIKKQRNRINARKCRQRKKQYVENLETKTKSLQLENSKLSGQVLKLNQKNINLQQEIENLKLALKRSNEKIILQGDTSNQSNNENIGEIEKDQSNKIMDFITNLTTIPSFNSDLFVDNEQQQQQQQKQNAMSEQLFNNTHLNKKYKATFFVILLTFGLFFTNPDFIDLLAEIAAMSWKRILIPKKQFGNFLVLVGSLSEQSGSESSEESLELEDQIYPRNDNQYQYQYQKKNQNKNPKFNTNDQHLDSHSIYCDDHLMREKISNTFFSSSSKNKQFSS
ncbi:transcription factor ap-1 [Anaeramoeba flamelloides]|uniref:Transcription factor ap-1 n=1 Tax=Anaeramoeba flamelloides TaxID=1746091 RepID=A0AAV7ZN29_9EUKA|nr:transcription factor ap-1 [Anaeramoeba flamelloides]